MNAKNKIYGTRGSQCQAATEEVQVIEKLYEQRKVFSEPDKSSSSRGSYDFDCCTENSVYESSRIYAKACGQSGSNKVRMRGRYFAGGSFDYS